MRTRIDKLRPWRTPPPSDSAAATRCCGALARSTLRALCFTAVVVACHSSSSGQPAGLDASGGATTGAADQPERPLDEVGGSEARPDALDALVGALDNPDIALDTPNEASADLDADEADGGVEADEIADGRADEANAPSRGWADLTDGFDGTALAPDWTVLNADLFELSVSGGALHIVPHENRAWFLDASGPGVVKEITGDFVVTSTVRARRADEPDELIDDGYQFGGLIARDPRSADIALPENYVFNVIGWRGEYFSAETKNTVNDLSMVDAPPWPFGDAELRICRRGSQLRLYNRPVGGTTWQHAITYTRTDLPETLQVGPIAYTYTWSWNLRASFEGVTFAPATSDADCTT